MKEHASRAGVSLIELLAAMLILVIVFAAWVNISNFQAVRKESLRREALEKAAGMLDFVSRQAWPLSPGYYRVYFDGDAATGRYKHAAGSSVPMRMFEERDPGRSIPPIGYVLRVARGVDGEPNGRWARIWLYDQYGVRTNDQRRPFSSLKVYMMDSS